MYSLLTGQHGGGVEFDQPRTDILQFRNSLETYLRICANCVSYINKILVLHLLPLVTQMNNLFDKIIVNTRFFYKNVLYKNVEAEICRKFKNVLRMLRGSNSNHTYAKSLYCGHPIYLIVTSFT